MASVVGMVVGMVAGSVAGMVVGMVVGMEGAMRILPMRMGLTNLSTKTIMEAIMETMSVAVDVPGVLGVAAMATAMAATAGMVSRRMT